MRYKKITEKNYYLTFFKSVKKNHFKVQIKKPLQMQRLLKINKTYKLNRIKINY